MPARRTSKDTSSQVKTKKTKKDPPTPEISDSSEEESECETLFLETCGVCERPCPEEKDCPKKGDISIECDSCNRWFHRKCLKLTVTDTEWESLRGQNPSILFKCQPCVKGRGEKLKEMKEIKKNVNQKMDDVQNEVCELKQMLLKNNDAIVKQLEAAMMPKVNKIITTEVNKMASEIDSKYEKRLSEVERQLEENKSILNKNTKNPPTQENLLKMVKEVKQTEVKIEEKIETELKVYMDKKQDKELRKNNIIILRLNEQASANVEECLEKDKAEVKKILEIISPELTAELSDIVNKKKFLRLGKTKKADKIRPIKIELKDEHMKTLIFEGCRNLKDSSYNHISIQNDLTKDEQTQQFKLRQEVRRRKAAGELVCIYNNEIINQKDHPKNNKKDEEDKEGEDEEEREDKENDDDKRDEENDDEEVKE